MAKKQTTFEKAVERLDEIVKELEQGQISLDDAVKVFEEGMELYRLCSTKLQNAEKKIEKLVKTEKGFQLELMEGLDSE